MEAIQKNARSDIYLVGGAVRNLLLEKEVTDYDFAYAGDAVALAQSIAEDLDGTYILLDKEHNIARVVLKKSKEIVLDFAGYKGNTLLEDLKNRDFTINAMALPLTLDKAQLIDPLNGKEALASKQIIATSKSCISDDPVRIMRAVRFAGEFNYSIDPLTVDLLKKDRKLLGEAAYERIRDELFKAFTKSAYNTVKLLEELELIEIIFPELQAAVGVEQNRYHTLDVWNHILEVLKQLEQNVLDNEEIIDKELREYLTQEYVTGRNKAMLLKFAALIHDVGKPVVKKVHPQKGVIFWGHEEAGMHLAKKISQRFVLAKKEINFITDVVKYHMRPLFLTNASAKKKSYFKFFKDTGTTGLAIIIHSIADSLGGKASDPVKEQNLKNTTQKLIAYYFNEYLPLQQQQLVTGKDILMLKQDIPPEKIGRLLEVIQEERASGKLKNRDEALNFLKKKI